MIGTSGAVIKDLQSKSGARIQIDQDFPPDVPRKINITGNPSIYLLVTKTTSLILPFIILEVNIRALLRIVICLY